MSQNKSATNQKSKKQLVVSKSLLSWKKKLEVIQDERKRQGKEFSLVTSTDKMVTTFLTKDTGQSKPIRLEINITIDKSGTRGLLDGLGHRNESKTPEETEALYEDFLKRIEKFDQEKAVTDNSRKEVRKFSRA